MGKRGRKNVFVALHTAGVAGQEKLKGVLRHLGKDTHWDIQFVRTQSDFTREAVRRALNSGTDGFLISLFPADDALEDIARSGLPTVALDIENHHFGPPCRNLALLMSDDVGIGRAAAREFLAEGTAAAMAFLGFHSELPWTAHRERGFIEELDKAGLKPIILRLKMPEHGIDTRSISRWVRRLPRPVRIFAVCDDLACALLNVCRNEGLRVPEDITVLGVNNDVLLCTSASPTLSSIQPDFGGLGEHAARTLDAMMDGKPSDGNTIFLPLVEIVRRRSTPLEATGAGLVRRALEFIDANLNRPLAVADVVRHLGVSRQLADLRFREMRGETLYEALVTLRLENVCHRLAETNDAIEKVSIDCGWENPISLKNLFKRRYGVSMRTWRACHVTKAAT